MFKSLAQVGCFLLDMDGTFYLGDRLLEGSVRFMETLTQIGKDYLFITNNSSRSRKHYAEKFSRIGFPVPDEKIFTSGEATISYLKEVYAGAKVFLAGTPSLEEEFRQEGFSLVESNADIVVLGFDTTINYLKLWKMCDLVRSGLPYIATHPDLNCPTPEGYMPDIGAMIAFIKASSGRDPDRIIGKPGKMMAEIASKKVGRPLKELAMVGDRLYTDIAMGKTAGILTILVLSGETSAADVEGSASKPDYIFDNLGMIADRLL